MSKSAVVGILILFLFAYLIFFAPKNQQDEAKNVMSAVGNFIGKISGDEDFGKPKCLSDADCVQFGINVTCNVDDGKCFGGKK